MMKFKNLIFAILTVTTLQACSNFIYRIDIPQGNFLEQKDVDKLRVGMTREQVIYVLGRPVVKDSFDHDTWYYLYELKPGMTDDYFRKELVINFDDDGIVSVTGDFELSEEFNIPFNQ